MGKNSFAWGVAAACILRLGLIVFGVVQDAYLAVKYTDVDYEVRCPSLSSLLHCIVCCGARSLWFCCDLMRGQLWVPDLVVCVCLGL